MNLLVVDDNKNNRMILSLLLEDYMDENEGVSFCIDEAVDGLEAIRMCESKEYSIVFMDIMMPNMDGIEATKLIRQQDKKVMIIAVSAVDDTLRQKEILSHGAEDYISKPINSDIFSSRIANYVHLTEARAVSKENKINNENGVNLFTKEIYNRYTNFNLSSEDALSELWEYYLLAGEEKCENLSDVVRMVFSLGEVQLRLGIKSNLFVEEAENNKYFTVTNIKDVPDQVIKLLIKKNEIQCAYKMSEDKISFELVKMQETVAVEEPVFVSETLVSPSIEEVEEEEIASSLDYTSSSLEVFDYIDSDDMLDLEEYAGKLSSLMLIVGSGDVSEEEAIEIYTYIEKVGAILSSYSEIYKISHALTVLSSEMSSHLNVFMQNAEAIGPMCRAFSKDLMNWIEQSFHTGAPSVDFMNDTIAVNCQTIGSMLTMNDAPPAGSEDDFDDIFDF